MIYFVNKYKTDTLADSIYPYVTFGDTSSLPTCYLKGRWRSSLDLSDIDCVQIRDVGKNQKILTYLLLISWKRRKDKQRDKNGEKIQNEREKIRIEKVDEKKENVCWKHSRKK